MKLQDILSGELKLGIEAIAQDSELAKQIQILLIGLKLLEPPADGNFGPISATALKKFQALTKAGEVDYIGTSTAKLLIETKAEDLPAPQLQIGNDLASRLIKYMVSRTYQVFNGTDEYSIVYAEGLNPDGTPNNDEPNKFNDTRFAIKFVDEVPKIVGAWEATTEPGRRYTYNPMNPGGAARIKFGQYVRFVA